MDFEKEINEAFERAKQAYASSGNNQDRKKLLEEIFPQLKPDKDAIIKKIIEDFLDNFMLYPDVVTKEDARAWLAAKCAGVQAPESGPLSPYWVEGRGVFVPVINKVISPEDLPEEMYWNDAMKATDGHMGTKRDWAFIYAWKSEINTLLREHDAEEIHDDWYWTETENSATFAWLLTFDDGNQYGNYKSTGRYRVRPVSAF